MIRNNYKKYTPECRQEIREPDPELSDYAYRFKSSSDKIYKLKIKRNSFVVVIKDFSKLFVLIESVVDMCQRNNINSLLKIMNLKLSCTE